MIAATAMTLDTGLTPANPANRLGLLYRHEATRLPWSGPIWDVHTHLHDLEAARLFFEVAGLFGVEKVWTMSPLEQVDELRAEFGSRIEFIAVPNYQGAHTNPNTFTTDWLHRIEGFAAKGCRVCKFWAAPRGRDFHHALRLDSPIRHEGMRLARSLGMTFMTHIADPDTWFANQYRDHRHYGTKVQQYEALGQMLDEYHDVTWIAAHMGGHPEDLDHLQGLLDRHPNLHLDCSATKWMVRELSKHPGAFAAFCRRNPGRVLFGSDNVADAATMSFDLLASRYWALRVLLETDYQGPSPIDDPDLLQPGRSQPTDGPVDSHPTATIHGAQLDPTTLATIYHRAAQAVMPSGVL